ncbi:hypothetical protein MIND_00615300 [Mycena indigotica]|uniref:Origin recognition complex subunit 5 n=1 Tax=Mycena indigotica TaxID=2126181 RepID=A0A8H6W351_9AGAR|nr:uncharacterized protein MIND_00615300 [Mycena indigotica]KAF7303854.1 hypothetical protein MIND_00615300 [Mycena indigotica]
MAKHPGYEPLTQELSSLLTGSPPPFIYVHDPISSGTTAGVISSVLKTCASAPTPLDFAHVNAVACFQPRILYDTVLNQLAKWQPRWSDGCVVWGGEEGERWNQNIDGFLHGLKAVNDHLKKTNKVDGQLVIFIEKAERLQDNIPELIVPLARLAELSRLNLSVILLSDVSWEEFRPPFGGSPDPYFMDVAPLDKKAHVARLNSVFDKLCAKSSHTNVPTIYHPSLRNLYNNFAEIVVDTCYVYVQDPAEIQYVAAARWPGFAQPVLDAHNDSEDPDTPLEPPSEYVRMRLIRLFKPSFKAALETLYPRHDHALNWAASHAPEPNLLSKPPSETKPLSGESSKSPNDDHMADLPRMAKFLLIAAYLASTNPQMSDLRMFGRGLDEKKRKRRINRAAPKSGIAKLPQRVLGPNIFPVERLLAILGALLEENDADRRPEMPQYTIPGEYTDMETSRVNVFTTIVELADSGLLQRASSTDKLDGATFKCGITYDTAAELSSQLDVPLNDLLWDPA